MFWVPDSYDPKYSRNVCIQVDLWNDFVDERGSMEIMVPPDSYTAFTQLLDSLDVKYTIQNSNVQK